MGNFLIKKKKINNQGYVNLLQDFDSSVPDVNLVHFTSNELNNNEDFKTFKRDIVIWMSNIQNKISKLDAVIDQKVNDSKKMNNNKIYTINEQINLIQQDLKSLINNDKILLDNFQKIMNTEQNNFQNLNSISISLKEKSNNSSPFQSCVE